MKRAIELKVTAKDVAKICRIIDAFSTAFRELLKEMRRDQAEIVKLRKSTRAILSELKAGKRQTSARSQRKQSTSRSASLRYERRLMEDFGDILIAESRRKEPCETLASVEKRLKQRRGR